MKRGACVFILGLFVVVSFCLAGCGSDNDGKGSSTSETPNISMVTYRVTSGMVSPAFAWDETYTISSAGVTFKRSAYSENSTVNTGVWAIGSYGTNEVTLFNTLSGPDVYAVKKTGEENSPPIGGGVTDYSIRYDNGVTVEVVTGSGYIYNNSALITTPINTYISSVTLPVEAVNRFK